LLGFVVILVVAGVAANVSPIRHYQDARARLEKVGAEVKGLEEQKAVLQAQLAKLSETGYLEGLAREELTYARADEELYIVTESAGGGGVIQGAAVGRGAGTATDDASGSVNSSSGGAGQWSRVPSAGIGAGMPGADLLVGSGIGVAVPGADRAAGESVEEAGFLERMLTAVEGLF
jgi:cell division protein FtsB